VGYVKLIVDILPTGIKGLLLASFAAAFMSTISTQLNWGSSYLVNDFYKRFINKKADAKHYVFVSRIATVLILIFGAIATMLMDSISGAWKFLLALGAGTGLVYILRWYWWRINAWSEISAMLTSLIVSIFLQYNLHLSTEDPHEFSLVMLITVCVSTAVWICVTFLTKPEHEEVLIEFYKKVRPAGTLWRAVYEKHNLEVSKDSPKVLFKDWILGIILVYSFLFGLGKIILGNFALGALLIFMAITSAFILIHDLKNL